MVDENDLMIVIPARQGSKRLVHKNVLPLHGKPLVAWTIEAAITSQVCRRVLITTDDDDVFAIAKHYPQVLAIRRPTYLASDAASSVDVALHALHEQESLDGVKIAALMLLQPTSPMRTAFHIVSAYERFERAKGLSVVSVCKVGHPLAWCGTIDADDVLRGFDVFDRRKARSSTDEYRLNGAIYLVSSECLRSQRSFFSSPTLAYRMTREESIDIDTQLDFDYCELAMTQRSSSPRSQMDFGVDV